MITRIEDAGSEALEAELRELEDRLDLDDLEEALHFPKYFQAETTRVCNARCPFCPVDVWDKSVPMMPDDLFEKIASEMSDYSDWINVVMVQRAGEPLLDKKIVSRVQRLKDANIKVVSMSTNASMLSRQKSEELLNAGLDEIMLSIDSVDRENYEKMRVQLDYDTVLQNIETLFEVRETLKPDLMVRVRGVSFFDLSKDEEAQELERWEGFWSRFRKPQDRIYMKRAHNWGNQIELDDRVTSEVEGTYGDVYHPCILPWSTMHITAMGTVALCPMDYDGKMNLGNIHSESIAQVWRNPKWSWVRRLHESGNRNGIQFCHGCKLFDLDFSLEKKEDPKELYES